MTDRLGRRWFLLALAPLLWAPWLAGLARPLGERIPGSDPIADYWLGVAAAVAVGWLVCLLPIRTADRRVLAGLWQAKVIVTLGVMLFYERHYSSLDAFTYYRWSLDPTVGWPSVAVGQGTFNVVALVKVLDLVLPSSYHAFKLVFSFVGLLGVYAVYRAARRAGALSSRLGLVALGLFPSIAFWSSILGKDPLALAGLGGTVLGLATVRSERARGALFLAAGSVLLLLVRPWLAAMTLGAVAFTALTQLLRGRPRTWQVATGAILLAGTIGAAILGARALGISSWSSFLIEFDDVTHTWGYGGSAQQFRTFRSLADILEFLPLGAFTALYRPLPGDNAGPWIFTAVVVAEGCLLLGWTLLALVRVTRERLRPAWVNWTLAYIAAWLALYSFISYQNLGTAVRFRLGVLPFMMLVLLWLARPGPRVHGATLRVRAATDAVLAALALTGLAVLAAVRLVFPLRPHAADRRLLVLDVSYDLATVEAQGLQGPILARDLGGYFEHVWTVHPLVGAQRGASSGPVTATELAPRHTVLESPLNRPGMPLAYPRIGFVAAQGDLLWRLDRLVRSQGVSVVRAGDPYYQGLVGLWLARANRIPFVVRIGGNYDEIHALTGRLAYPRLFRTRATEKRIERFVLSRTDLVAGANDNNLAFAVGAGARPGHTAVFRYGNLVHPAHFTPPQERPAAVAVMESLDLADRPTIVFVGRLEPAKHAGDLVEVLRLVRQQVPEAALLVIGDGSLRPAMEQAANATGVSEGIVFAGTRDQQWIAAALAGATAVASPHMGRALVECALAGLPLVAYDLDWQRELVDDGACGYLTPPQRPDAMAQRLVELLQDPPLAARLGAEARRRALQMMDPGTLAAGERAAYDRLLGRSGAT